MASGNKFIDQLETLRTTGRWTGRTDETTSDNFASTLDNMFSKDPNEFNAFKGTRASSNLPVSLKDSSSTFNTSTYSTPSSTNTSQKTSFSEEYLNDMFKKPSKFTGTTASASTGTYQKPSVAEAILGTLAASTVNLGRTAIGTIENTTIGRVKDALWYVNNPLPKSATQEEFKTRLKEMRTSYEKSPLARIRENKNATVADQMKGIEENWTKFAALETQTDTTKFFANTLASLPSSLITRIPFIGWAMMFNQSYVNSVEQTKAMYEAQGLPYDDKKANLKGLGDASIEVISEMMFPLFGQIGGKVAGGSIASATKGLISAGLKKLGFKGVTDLGKLSLKTVMLATLKEAGGEGLEEVVAALGQAGVAKLTTNPNDPYWGTAEEGGLTNGNALLTAFSSGAVMGGGMTLVRGGTQLATKKLFPNTTAKIDAVKDVPMNDIPPETTQDILDTMSAEIDVNKNGEKEYVVEQNTKNAYNLIRLQGQNLTTKSGKQLYVPVFSAADESNMPSELRQSLSDAQQTQSNKTTTPVQETPSTAPSGGYTAIVERITPEVDSIAVSRPGTPNRTLGGYTVVDNLAQKRRASITESTKTITLGRDFYAIPEAQRKEALIHEFVHSQISDAEITQAQKLPIFRGKTKAEISEGITQIAFDLISNPNFITENPALYEANKERYDYVANTILSKVIWKENAPQATQRTTAQPQTVESKPPTSETTERVTLEDLPNKVTNEKSVEQVAQEYVDSEEGQADFEKFKDDPVGLALDLQNKIDTQYFTSKRVFDVETAVYELFARKLENIPQGKDVRRYLVHMLRAVASDKPAEFKARLEKEFTKENLLYSIYSNETAIKKANDRIAKAMQADAKIKNRPAFYTADKQAKEIIKNLDENKVPTPEEIVLISEYVKRLSNMEDGTGVPEFENVAKRVAKLATKLGRAVQAFTLLNNTFPEYRAEKIAGAYEQALKRTQQEEKIMQDIEIDAESIVKKARQNAGKQLGEQLDKAVKESKPSTKNMSPAERFERSIVNSLKQYEPKVQEEILKRIKNLMVKFHEVTGKTGIKQTENPYYALFQIVTNRAKYAETWKQTQDLMQAKYDSNTGITEEQYNQINKFFTEVTEVPYIQKFFAKTVVHTLKRAGISVSEMARKFNFAEAESISEFAELVRQRVESTGFPLDEQSYQYLEKYLIAEFKQKMKAERKQSMEAFLRQAEKIKKQKKFKSEQEYIIDELTKATYYDVFADGMGRIREIWAQNLGIPIMTDEIKNMIYDTMRQMSKTTDEAERNRLYDAMVQKLADNIPSTMQEKITGWMRTAMLFNPTTLLRNMIANIIVAPFYRTSDVLANVMINHARGIEDVDKIAGDTFKSLDSKDDVGKLVLKTATDDTINRYMSKTAKYSIGMLMGMQKKLYKTKFLNELASIPYEIMSKGTYKKFSFKPLGDSYKFQQHFRNALYNKLIAMHYTEASTENQKEIMDSAMDYAAEQATLRTFRAMNMISSFIKNAQSSVLKYKGGAAVSVGMKILTPFVITPAALVSESYKFSPLALAKAVLIDVGTGQYKKYDSAQKADFYKRVSQALVGTVFQFGAGMLLNAFGMLTGAPPEDEKEKELWALQGKRPYSIYINGRSYSIDWAQPVAIGLMMGAQALENADKAGTTLEKAGAFVSTPIDMLIRSSIIQNIAQQITLSKDYKTGQFSASKFLSNMAQNGLTQAMPGLIKKINSVLDPYQRDAYSGTAIEVFKNRILSSTPGGSFFVPKKIDIWGNEVTTVKQDGVVGGMERFMLSLMSPFLFSGNKMDDTTREVARVYEASKGTQGSKALPSIVENKIERTKNKEKEIWDLTAEEYVDYQQRVGKLSKEKIDKIISSQYYKNLTDEKKALKFAEAYADAKETAKNEYIKAHPKPK